jgi:hypothetical protein
VPARLENLKVCAPEDAINPVLDHGGIARAKPTLAEGIARCLGLPPVFREHARTTDFNLARCSRRNRLAILVDQPHLHARQWSPDASRHTLAPHRI